jgi:hypothetical protein
MDELMNKSELLLGTGKTWRKVGVPLLQDTDLRGLVSDCDIDVA